METITCKNCGNTFEDKFCNHCGQKNFTDKDKSFKHLVDEIIHFFTHIEGSFINTFKAILTKPGQLSRDYCNGKRKTYYKPVSFFLLIVLLYLIFPIAKGMNMKMENYKNNKISGKFIGRQIESKLATEKISMEALTLKFHNLSSKTSKVLLLLLIPFSALFIFLMFFRRRKYAFDHFILATEFNSFMMLAFLLFMPIILFLIMLIFRIPDNNIDGYIEPFIAVAFLVYITLLFRRFFNEKWIFTIPKAIVFLLSYLYVILPLYQLIIFEVTFAFI